MNSGVDGRPKALCGQCRRKIGVDEDSVVCPYCMATLTRRNFNVRELCRTNRAAHAALCRVRGQRIWSAIWTVLLGFIFMNLMHNSIADGVYGLTFVGVLYGGWWYTRNRVKPRFPEVFDNPLFSYGIPEDTPAQQVQSLRE